MIADAWRDHQSKILVIGRRRGVLLEERERAGEGPCRALNPSLILSEHVDEPAGVSSGAVHEAAPIPCVAGLP